MSKAKSTSLFKTLFLVVLCGLAGIGGAAGLAYAGWRMVSADGARSGDEPQSASKEAPGGIAGWLHSADEKL